jgi:hypothetical protein
LTNHFEVKGKDLGKMNAEAYIFEQVAKYTKLTVDRLIQHQGVKWYHKVIFEGNRALTQRIEFVDDYASLEIQLLRNGDEYGVGFQLTTSEGQVIEEQDLHLFFGFLRHDATYYVLKLKDMNVLHLIGNLNIEQHKHNLPAFVKYVLGPIEKTHPVRRENLVDIELTELAPKKILHLTELAGSFLVITPKFDYGLATFESQFQEFPELVIDGQ